MAARSEHTTVFSDSSSTHISGCRSSSFSSTSSIFSLFSHTAEAASTSSCPIMISSSKRISHHDNIHEHVFGWLEAMRASSPRTTNFLVNDELNNSIHDEARCQYIDWVAKHPSALCMFDEIMKMAIGKQVIVFLDYDGTLSPIVEDPDCAFMSDEMRDTVKKVAACFPTAIITGRNRDKVFEFVRLAELYYAGSHGMDIMGPAESCNGITADGGKVIDSKVCAMLKERARHYSGARVDHNKFCVTLHFRCVKEKDWLPLAEEVQTILECFPELSLTQGRKVLELRPSIEWHKGKALEFLLKSLGLDNSADVLPVYIGDDRTDEDAFNVLRERGIGCSILVSKVAKETCAAFSLQDPTEVMEFLQHLVRWRATTL
eukprot:c22189_g1_i2 orf=1054-2178(+)